MRLSGEPRKSWRNPAPQSKSVTKTGKSVPDSGSTVTVSDPAQLTTLYKSNLLVIGPLYGVLAMKARQQDSAELRRDPSAGPGADRAAKKEGNRQGGDNNSQQSKPNALP